MRSAIYGRSGCRCEELRHAACILRRAPSNAPHPLLGGFVSEGTRPGGLTALAVLNFIGGGFGLLSALGTAAALLVINTMRDDPEVQNARHEMAKAVKEFGMGLFFALLAMSLLTSVLQIVAGIGYMSQKRGLGRGVGNAYALLAIAVNIATLVWLVNTPLGEFNLFTLVMLIYPVVTLFLLNVTFKEDFVH
jgi:hypothetical protein